MAFENTRIIFEREVLKKGIRKGKRKFRILPNAINKCCEWVAQI
jgi:hypothetical protein